MTDEEVEELHQLAVSSGDDLLVAATAEIKTRHALYQDQLERIQSQVHDLGREIRETMVDVMRLRDAEYRLREHATSIGTITVDDVREAFRWSPPPTT